MSNVFQSANCREFWVGSPNKVLASIYVQKIPLGHKFIYNGRIDGKKCVDQKVLKAMEVKILAKLYNFKAA